MNDSKILDISWGTILKIALALFCLYLIYLIKDILVWILFALIVSILFNPVINFLRKRHFPRIAATLLVYLAFFGILGYLISLIVPPFISETQKFTQNFPQYFEKISPLMKGLGIKAFESLEAFSQTLGETLEGASANIFSALSLIFGGILATIFIFSTALFLSLEEKGIERIIKLLTPEKQEESVLNIWNKSQKKVALWFGVRIIACVFVGLLTFLTCKVLAIDYAVSFGLFAGVLNLIPIIGPIITGIILALLISLTAWTKALFFLIAFIIIQQLEANILTPILTKKFVGIPAALVLIALMVGGKLWGILGAILTIPLLGIIFEFTRDFFKKRKIEKAAVL